jgi:hypothetical protein
LENLIIKLRVSKNQGVETKDLNGQMFLYRVLHNGKQLDTVDDQRFLMTMY